MNECKKNPFYLRDFLSTLKQKPNEIIFFIQPTFTCADMSVK